MVRENSSTTMKASAVTHFQATTAVALRRPWQTFKDGQIWYGMGKTGSKRHPLTTKQGNKHYYKGTGSLGYGKLNRDGKYIVDWTKVRTYVVPADLHLTPLKALVSPKVPQVYQKYVGYDDGAKSADLAFQNLVDFVEYGENYNAVDLEESGYLEEFVNPNADVEAVEAAPEAVAETKAETKAAEAQPVQ